MLEDLIRTLSDPAGSIEPGRSASIRPGRSAAQRWSAWVRQAVPALVRRAARVLVDRRAWVLGHVVIQLVVVAVGLAVVVPRYEARATVRIARHPSRVLRIQEVDSVPYARFEQDWFDRTQHRFARSRPVLAAAAELLAEAGVTPPESDAGNPIPWLKNGLNVRASVDDELVDLEFTDVDPTRAAAAATAIAEAWVTVLHERRAEETEAVRGWLADELQAQTVARDDAAAALLDALRAHPTSAGPRYERDLHALSAARVALADARVAASLAHARADALDAALRAYGPANLLPNMGAGVEALAIGRADARLALALADATLLEAHPERVRALARVEAVERDVAARSSSWVAEARARAAFADRYVASLVSEVARIEGQVATSGQWALEDRLLLQEFERTDGLQRTLARRLAEVELVSALPRGWVEVLERAAPPSAPTWPDRGEVVVAALVLGLLGGVVLAVAADVLDRTIRDADHVRAVSASPVLAVLPYGALPASLDGPTARGAAWAAARLAQVASPGPTEPLAVWLVPVGPAPVGWVWEAISQAAASAGREAAPLAPTADPSAPHGAVRLALTPRDAPRDAGAVEGFVLVVHARVTRRSELAAAEARLRPAATPLGIVLVS